MKRLLRASSACCRTAHGNITLYFIFYSTSYASIVWYLFYYYFFLFIFFYIIVDETRRRRRRSSCRIHCVRKQLLSAAREILRVYRTLGVTRDNGAYYCAYVIYAVMNASSSRKRSATNRRCICMYILIR